jgi:hypothetical protein
MQNMQNTSTYAFTFHTFTHQSGCLLAQGMQHQSIVHEILIALQYCKTHLWVTKGFVSGNTTWH